ncbi:hypothetical protein SAE02_75770 [Skermanella aerolata]|uniref:PAS domain-containing protein n=1 Tax=Skermanella aerolata TaxID=393310 RepID=A0A512E402_9PROT|nr:PAS domain-containing protein [Skermanella aerolata]KJB90566.1 hypothetical protein N826_38920 [Skermanella aerolata KACC 11604]GEO43429.1 hypothetical protein SAE02_75770 [Skermanella aerolata]
MNEEAHPRIQSLVELWRLRCAPGEIPRRSDLNVFALKPWLGYLTIFEEIDHGVDFLVRLDGQVVVNLTGVEWTGHKVSQLAYSDRVQLLEVLRSVQTSRQPLLDVYHFPVKGKLRPFSRALLPVRDDKRGAGQVIQCLWPVSDHC